jgi:hypothetical protein
MIFVGMEIRQSNAQARAAAYQALGIATAEAFDTWAHDANFSEVWSKSPAAMDSADWRQFALKMTVFARLGETVLLQVEQEILPQDAMDRLGYRGWRTVFEDPKVGCIWPIVRPGVSDAFRGFVEEGRDAMAVDCTPYPVPNP